MTPYWNCWEKAVTDLMTDFDQDYPVNGFYHEDGSPCTARICLRNHPMIFRDPVLRNLALPAGDDHA